MSRMTYTEWEDTFGPVILETDTVPEDTPINKVWSFVQAEWEEDCNTDKFIIPGISTVSTLKYYITKHAYTYTDQVCAVTYN